MSLFAIKAIDFLGSWLGRLSIAGTLAGLFTAWLLLHDSSIRKEARNGALFQVDQEARNADFRGQKARDAIDNSAGSAVSELRRRYCINCNAQVSKLVDIHVGREGRPRHDARAARPKDPKEQ